MERTRETPPRWAIINCLINLAALLLELHSEHWF
ncbi:Uncharacterised protein [Mycobacteroides abscessus subsp. massiliense]|jgi:hypothetical protein|nr:Uncharacterised protein [Mycobacteroides abscessus subsp. abscessus]SKI16614.1 Uncharacterised protein [Mycobacteroides abscessus subsp. massiliense]SKM86859.1 Uncharacterised protein [Mycobacteroides abscessus subsp. massiliense]SKN76184.1 Uncharacterised protein [Mycobacteroides abscessus subsp. massiliense]SKN84075.1 Uncharacterised protein [Mycobacteroides abscessus subsp. massiliense]